VDAAATSWMLAMSAIFSTSALALLLVIGALVGSASLASAAGFLGAFVFIVPAATVLLALRFENYRLVNFWMILIGGWMLVALLAHRRIAPGDRASGISGDSSGHSPGRDGLRELAGHVGRMGHAGRPGVRSASGAGLAPRRRPGLLGAGPGRLAGHRV
jgi:hypothetical protein